MFIISGITICIAFSLSLVFSRRTIRAIQNVVNVIVAAAAGDLRKTAIATTHDELWMLATKLNQMIAQLRSISGQVQTASQAVTVTADAILKEMGTLNSPHGTAIRLG
jgi:methyl-accepting chemotaxis protein